MAPTPLLKPHLYSDDPSGPTLLGGACECGFVFFPMQSFGCERCGKFGAALQAKRLRGSGRLVASALVHIHADKRRAAPFAVGTIALDDGPVIRTLLAEVSDTVVGKPRVKAVLVPVTSEDGAPALDLRFRVVHE